VILPGEIFYILPNLLPGKSMRLPTETYILTDARSGACAGPAEDQCCIAGPPASTGCVVSV